MFDHLRNVWQELMIASLMGGLGGVFYYLTSIEEGKKFSWFSFILNTFISAFSGLFAYICIRHLAGLDPDVCSCFSGVAGWMGTRLWKLVELRVTKKIL